MQRPMAVLVVLIVVGMATVIFLAAMTETHYYSRRSRCTSNLKQIGTSMQLYANDNGAFPRTRYDPDKPLGKGFTGARAANAFVGDDAPEVNDPTAALFLLVTTTDMTTQMFVCDRTNDVPYTWQGSAANFGSAKNLSYSFTNMYPSKQAVERGYKWSPGAPADFAIAADRNDADPAAFNGVTRISSQGQQMAFNSHNHGREGQNVLFNDGHAEWFSNAWCGAEHDNIFTSALLPPTIIGSDLEKWPEPQHALDTVLVPRKGYGF
jgi:hypothetical protein